MRLSATDWLDDGWSLEESVQLAALLREEGVDLVDTSTGGNAPAEIPVGPGYQVPFARSIRAAAQIATGAVGLITDAKQAEDILADGSADVVLLGTRAAARPALAAAGRPRARRARRRPLAGAVPPRRPLNRYAGAQPIRSMISGEGWYAEASGATSYPPSSEASARSKRSGVSVSRVSSG